MINSPDTPRVGDIPGLTGLRFVAAFCIMLSHLLLGLISPGNQYLGAGFAACGVLGMNTFFILSGFIIHYNYRDQLASLSARALWKFFAARFSRLYPLYICLFSVDFLTNNQNLPHREAFATLPFFLTLSQSWFYHQMPDGASLVYIYARSSIAWSISAEMLMYCAYPFILKLVARDALTLRSRVAATCTIVVVIGLFLRIANNNMAAIDPFAAALFGQGSTLAESGTDSFPFWLIFLSPYLRIFEFIIGVAVAHCFIQFAHIIPTRRERILGGAAGLFSLGLIILSLAPPLGLGWHIIQCLFALTGYYPFIALLLFTLARYPGSLVTRLMSTAPFVTLGERSYSIYLFHIYVYLALAPAASNSLWTIGFQIAALWFMVIPCAFVLYQFIEMPMRKWLRAILLIFLTDQPPRVQRLAIPNA